MNQLHLVRATNEREALMRLPTDSKGNITPKGLEMIAARFFEDTKGKKQGTTAKKHGLRSAVNLERYQNGYLLSKAIEKYYL